MSKEFPKISIVTPSFNQGQYLEQTILSVLDQRYPNLEYFILDGGSTDNSATIIKKYEKHLAGWASEKDKGQCDAINKGLSKCTGEIFNWLNSDDHYFPETLNKVAENFSDPTINVVCGRTRVFNEKGAEKIVPASFVDPNDLLKTLCHSHIEQPSTFFRMKAVKKMGMLSQKLHYVMDKEWWIKYLIEFGVANIFNTDDVFVNFRHHDDSKTISAGSDFFNDQATILYSLCEQKKLKDHAHFLLENFNINEEYKFESGQLVNLDPSIVKRMTEYFLLWKGSLIFEKDDFELAKNVLKNFNWEDVKLYEDELSRLKHIREITASKNWQLFRMKRKWDSFF